MDSNKGKRKFTEIVNNVNNQHLRLRSKFRKAITGDELKRVRDHVQEQPDYVKLLDKIAFTLGLLNILACEYFLVKLPTYFWLWYSLIIPLLILTRIFHFKSLGWQYFLLDFCYFVQLCVFLNLYVFTSSLVFFKICFIYANGPLTWAVVVWRNSLVFHDYDKITSVYIHFLPCALYYAGRWHGHNPLTFLQGSATTESIPLYEKLCLNDYILASIGYIFWQLLYFGKTEIVDKTKLDARPELLTSLRWMSSDKKNSFAKFVLGICRKAGFMRFNEHFDCFSTKTKIIFMGAQFLYSMMTFIPTIFLYNSQKCHIAFLIFIFCTSAFNGASFYIEVFSKVYQLKIEKLSESRKLADSILRTGYVNNGSFSERVTLPCGDEDQPSPTTDAHSPLSEVDEKYAFDYNYSDCIDGEKSNDEIYLVRNNGNSEALNGSKQDFNAESSSHEWKACAPCVEIFDKEQIERIQTELKKGIMTDDQ